VTTGITTLTLDNQQTWTQVADLNPVTIGALTQDFKLPEKFIGYMKDKRERARLEYDEITGFWLLIFREIYLLPNQQYETLPMSFVFNQHQLITASIKPDHYADQAIPELTQAIQDHRIDTTFELLCAYILRMVTAYFDAIDAIDDARTNLEDISGRPTDKEITQLTNLSKSLVYITTATNNSLIALRQLQLSSDSRRDVLTLNAKEKARLGDAIVEVSQALQMAQIATDIVDRVENAYNNMLNNRLNETMRFLTIWSIVLMIPPIVSGFYGMNVKLPLADGPFAWILTIIWSLLAIGLLIWRFYRNSDL
jgi:magnesium transporter